MKLKKQTILKIHQRTQPTNPPNPMHTKPFRDAEHDYRHHPEVRHPLTLQAEHRTLDGKSPNYEPDIERFMRFLDRARMIHECAVCGEWFPSDDVETTDLGTRHIVRPVWWEFSCCLQCWLENDELDEYVNFDAVTPERAAQLYEPLQIQTLGYLAPCRMKDAPMEIQDLHLLESWLTPEKIQEGYRRAGISPYLTVQDLYWVRDVGLVPYGYEKKILDGAEAPDCLHCLREKFATYWHNTHLIAIPRVPQK